MTAGAWTTPPDDVAYLDEPPAYVGPPPPEDEEPVESKRLVKGGAFIFDVPSDVPALWGRDDEILWAEGESLIIVGPPGVGKTTLVGQVVLSRMGLGGPVLGMPVQPTTSRVLYLAMDRPRQISRALHRTFTGHSRALVDERLVFWPGPPLADIAKHPTTLVGLAKLAGADTVIVDSVKDAAVGLRDDEVGAGYNRARQMCLAEGVEVLELHHTVKHGQNGSKPNTLADVYGSVWLTAGAGSVVLLWGSAGDPIVELTHLKQPAAEVGPFKVNHDHDRGRSTVWHAADLLTMLRSSGAGGLTAKAAARVMFTTDKPTQAQVEKARRRLDALAKDPASCIERSDGSQSRATTWTFTQGFTAPPAQDPVTTPSRGSHEDASSQVTAFTDPLTPFTDDPPSRSHPPLYKGVGEGEPPDLPTDPDECHTCHRFTCDGNHPEAS